LQGRPLILAGAAPAGEVDGAGEHLLVARLDVDRDWLVHGRILSHDRDPFVAGVATLEGPRRGGGCEKVARPRFQAGGQHRVLVAEVEGLSKRYGTVQAL